MKKYAHGQPLDSCFLQAHPSRPYVKREPRPEELPTCEVEEEEESYGQEVLHQQLGGGGGVHGGVVEDDGEVVCVRDDNSRAAVETPSQVAEPLWAVCFILWSFTDNYTTLKM